MDNQGRPQGPPLRCLGFQFLFRLLRELAALVGAEVALADADVLRRDFEEFVLGDVLDALVEAHLAGRSQAYQNFGPGGAVVIIDNQVSSSRSYIVPAQES